MLLQFGMNLLWVLQLIPPSSPSRCFFGRGGGRGGGMPYPIVIEPLHPSYSAVLIVDQWQPTNSWPVIVVFHIVILWRPHHCHCPYPFTGFLANPSEQRCQGGGTFHPLSFFKVVIVIFANIKGIIVTNTLSPPHSLLRCPTVAVAVTIAMIVVVNDLTSLRPCPPLWDSSCHWILSTNKMSMMGLPLGPGARSGNNSYQPYIDSLPICPGKLLQPRGWGGGFFPGAIPSHTVGQKQHVETTKTTIGLWLWLWLCCKIS